MANVIQPFRDRLTWVAYAPGDEYAGDPARVSELAALGLVEAPGGARPEAGAGEAGDYRDMTVSQLRALCAERGVEVPRKATKAQLVGILSE